MAAVNNWSRGAPQCDSPTPGPLGILQPIVGSVFVSGRPIYSLPPIRVPKLAQSLGACEPSRNGGPRQHSWRCAVTLADVDPLQAIPHLGVDPARVQPVRRRGGNDVFAAGR